MSAPEFARAERLDTIGPGERTVTIEATPGECTALARRFGLVAVARLAGTFTLAREAAGVRVRGRVAGRVTQACSVTGEPLPATIEEAVDLLFMPAPVPADEGDEVELSDDSIDVVFHDGQAIDLGEAAAETLALALDPFPRGPNADAALKAAGVSGAGEKGAFAALATLLKKD